MQKTKIALAATLIGLAGYSSQGATIFTVEADFDHPSIGYELFVPGASTPEFTYEESVISRDETFDISFAFWDTLTSTLNTSWGLRTYFSGHSFPLDPVDATGVNYLHVTFTTPTHVVIEGLDALGDLQDVGPVLAPDGGSTIGLLGLAVAAIGVVRHRRLN